MTEQQPPRDLMVVMNSIHFNTVLIWNTLRELHPEVADRVFDETVKEFPKMVMVNVDEADQQS
jgi:hypothetical protein